MKKRATILLFTGLAVAAFADNPAVDSTYFHPAASLYIKGDITAASNLVTRGLTDFPDDGKLKRLKELIEQQQQNEQNQDQDQQQDQKEQDQNEQDEEQQQQNEPDHEQQDPTDQQQQPEPQRAEQMSEDEAERLLDAMKQEEKNKRLELHPVMGRPVQVDKDW